MYCKDKTILRTIARKLRQRAAKLESLAMEQEQKELRLSRNLIEPLLLSPGKGGNRTTSADRAYLLAMDKLRQAGLA
jgi:hypothetical protein